MLFIIKKLKYFYISKTILYLIVINLFKMASSHNIALYIKRIEIIQSNESVIRKIFELNGIGIVNDVTFTKKTDNSGREYNSAIVTFSQVFLNTEVKKLLDDMESSKDGTTKFIYDRNGRYWFINMYKPKIQTVDLECEELIPIDVNLSDKERIIALENLVRSMSVQTKYFLTQSEKVERKLMDYEQTESRQHLCNIELRYQLEDKDIEINKIKKECQDDVLRYKVRLACVQIDLNRQVMECDMLKQELSDERNITMFLQEELNNLREQIDEESYLPNISKMTIDELL